MWYADMAPIHDTNTSLLAVGWLERDRPFPTGAVDPAVYKRLVELP